MEGIFCWKENMINKTSVFLILHAAILSFIFIFRVLGIAADYVLVAVAAVVSLEAIYVALFTKSVVNKTSCSLREMEKEMSQIREDAFESAKLQRTLIYAGHQIKTIQGDLDILKRKLDFKSNGSTTKRNHYPLISHS